MASNDRKICMDLAAWAGNVSTSVMIIFVNKILMSQGGYGFHYATTLCALHYLACSLSLWITHVATGGHQKVGLPLKDMVLFVLTANASIVTLNLSLLINSVGYYQIAKLMIIPFVCLVEKFWLRRVFTPRVLFAVFIVIVGVSIVTTTDVSLEGNVLGLSIAALSVVSSGMQQIFVRTMQQKHKLSSHELLAITAPQQTWTLMLVGPFLDRYITGAWVTRFEWSTPALLALGLSCAVAVAVNMTQFLCLGRFSAVSFQVLGHSKTILVLLGGYLFLGDKVSGKQLFGIGLAICGMVLYGMANTPKPAAPRMKIVDPEKSALLKSPLLTSKGGDAHVDIVVASNYRMSPKKTAKADSF